MSVQTYVDSSWRHGRRLGRWAFRTRDHIARMLAKLEQDGMPIRTATREQLRDVIKAIDDSYPFGERKYHPYKTWCSEMQRLRDHLLDEGEDAITHDYLGFVMVARDMLEETGDVERVRAYLDEHTPGRHARPCPTCKARRRAQCRDLVGTRGPLGEWLLVPHDDRVRVGSSEPLPLFAGVS